LPLFLPLLLLDRSISPSSGFNEVSSTVIEVRGSDGPSVEVTVSLVEIVSLETSACFNESLLRIKFSLENVALIRFSPDALLGRLLLPDLVNLAAARDILCAVVSSLGVTGADIACKLLAVLARLVSVKARLPRRSSGRLMLRLGGVGGRSISVDSLMVGVVSLAPSK